MGSGKTSTSTQQVSIPPEVLARYNAVNARAEQVAQTPFQRYTGDFVAPLTGTQQAGIYGTSAAANLAQPFYGAGAGMTLAGAQNVGPLTQGQIAYYENPYIESVARPTYQALRQQQQEEMMGQTANAIRSGAFGGDRAGLVAANLARQQQLGMAQAMAPIYAQGYGQAVQTAAGQQGVVAQDLARQMAAGQQIAGLGTGAQQAALQGAQAQLAAGTAEQQTQQADLTARYNQFLQEQGYPFQVAQFLANIAMGTGALSGSTTTTQQPSSFFSDRRLKDNVEEIGKLKDGQKLYRYTMADGRTHIGLMADEVEKKHPDAVGLAGGYKTVDYRAATDDAARHKKAYGGGLAPSSEGGAVTPDMAGLGFARGGGIDDIRRMLTMHREMYPYGHVGLYGNPDARKGPYSSTMREINVPSRPLAPMTITVRPLNYAADVPAGVPQYASGGVVGYSQGGLPYSEASEEYVPEDISKPMTPASLKPAGGSTGPVQDPTVRDLMQIGRMAASLYSGMPFASGGVVPRMADGGPMDLDRVLAMQQQMYGSMGRPSGLNIPAGQARDPVKSMELMRPAKAPEPLKSGMQEAMDTYQQAEKMANVASGAYETGKTALLGREEVKPTYNQYGQQMTAGRKEGRGLVGSGGAYNPNLGLIANPSEILPEWMRGRSSNTNQTQNQNFNPYNLNSIAIPGMASGGVAGRLHYQDAGSIPNVMTQQDRDREAELENRLRQDYGLGARPVDAQVNNSNGQRQLSRQASEYINRINDPENINAMNENPNLAADLALSLARNPSSQSAVTPSREDSSAPPSTIRIVNPGQNPADAAPGQVVSSENNNQNDASSLTPGSRIQNLIDVFRGRYVPQYPAEDEYGPPQPDSQQESTVAPESAVEAAPSPAPAAPSAPPPAPPAPPAPAGGVAPPLRQIRQERPYASMNMPGMGEFMNVIANQESAGNPLASNPRSSAEGLFQFLRGTWNDVRLANPDLQLPETVLQASPEQQQAAYRRYVESNALTLQRLGVNPSYPNLALASYFGAGGANALLGIDRNTRFDELTDDFVRTRLGTRGQGPQSVAQLLATNPNLRGMTVGQLIDKYQERYGNIGQTREPSASPRRENVAETPTGVAGAAPVDDASYGRYARRGEPLRPISQQDMDSIRSRVMGGQQQTMSGSEGEGGLGSAIMNEKFLVPLLAGLGRMASSPSRYLGSAILQGLGTGALTYEKMANALPVRQKSQAEAYSQESALRDRLYNEFESYKALTGDFNLTIDEFAKKIGIPYKIAIPTPSTVAPSRGPAASGERPQMDLSLNGYRTATVSYPDGSTVRASNDPGYLREFIARNSSITAPVIASAVKDAEARLAQILGSGTTTDVNGREIFIPGRQEAKTSEQLRQESNKEIQEFVAAGNAFNQASVPQIGALRDLDKIYSGYQTQGSLAGPAASLAALARSLGIENKLPANFRDDDAKFQEAMKIVTAQIINSATQLPGNAIKTELATLQQTVASPRLSPEASRNIIVRTKAAIDYQRQIFNNYGDPSSGIPVNRYLQSANLEKMWRDAVERAEKETPQYGRRSSPAIVQTETQTAPRPPVRPNLTVQEQAKIENERREKARLRSELERIANEARSRSP